jgi:hypothetical protein
MNDELILRMLEDASKNLERVMFPVEVPHIVPIYNALLAAVKANHPGEPYLEALQSIEGAAGPEELRVLLGQLRILLETWMATDGAERPLATQRLATER